MNKALVGITMWTAIPILAQSNSIRFGTQYSISTPIKYLSNKAGLGLQLGGHAKLEINSDYSLMTRIDIAKYIHNNGTNIVNLNLGADCIYHFENHQVGPYLTAGINQQSYRTSFSDGTATKNSNGIGSSIGMGYDIDRYLGVQTRYVISRINHKNYSTMNIGVTYTF